MRVFIVPSWYPDKPAAMSGVFVRDQAEALAALGSMSVVVGLWGQGTTELPVRRPAQAARALLDHLSASKGGSWDSAGVEYHQHRRLSASRRLPWGGAGPMIVATRKNLEETLRRHASVDLIHAHVSYPGGYVAAVMSREFAIPYVLTEHMGPFPFPSLTQRGKPIGEIDVAMTGASAIVAVSPSLAKTIAGFGYPHPIVVPNLVDEREFTLGAPGSSKFRFLTLCGMNRQKGIDVLLRAIKAWDPGPGECEFVLAGGGDSLLEFRRAADELGLTDRVQFVGPVARQDVPQLMRSCHAFVLPSRHETFGVVLAEAAASGKPLISTRCGGPESIVNSTNGVLVAVGDVESLASEMKKMKESWSQFDAHAIRLDCISRFGREVVVRQLRGVYEGVLTR